MAVLSRALPLVLVFMTLTGCRTGPEQWGPFRGQVVDAETGTPIPGAHVMVLWIREPPNFHFTQWFYDAQETVTDASGRFEILHRARVLTAFVIEPGVSVFAPGYQMQTPQVTPTDGLRFVDPTVVRMRPLKTREEQCRYQWRGPSMGVGSAVPKIMEAMRQYAVDLNCRWPEGR